MSILDFLFKKQTNIEAIEVLNAEDFRNAISNKKVQLVDVRTSRELTSGHIKGAQNIDFFKQPEFKATFSKMNKDEPVYLYCQSGNRSQKAAKKLVAMGFSTVYDLRGGYSMWKY
jgi:rhodanese-related sulfurtransferase